MSKPARLPYDLSTLNAQFLRKLKAYELPPSYHLQDSPGNGCYGDAPGYPSYFTYSVYTSHGNNPPYREGRVTQVIRFEGKLYATGWYGQTDEQRAKLFQRLFKALPEDHPRVQAWIYNQYRHFEHCYRDVERPEHGRPGTLIFPVPDYKLETVPDLKSVKVSINATPEEIDAARRAHQAAVDTATAKNEAERLRGQRIATPDNHLAVIYIREFYPSHVARLDLIADPKPTGNQGDWWERHAERPTPETCPGREGRMAGGHVEDGWCQFCGYTSEPAHA